MIPRFKTTAVTGAPLATLAELKNHLRITQSGDDEAIMSLYSAALDLIQLFCGRALPQQTISLTLDRIPYGRMPWFDGVREGALCAFQDRYIPLVRPPTISVTSVSTYDLNNDLSVYPADQYFLSNEDEDQAARICLNIGSIWPVNLRANAAVKIIFEAGYADDLTVPSAPVSGVPPMIRHALKTLIAYLYEHRGEEVGNAMGDSGAMGFLAPYRISTPLLDSGADRVRQW